MNKAVFVFAFALLNACLTFGQCQLDDPDWDWENATSPNYDCYVIGYPQPLQPLSPFTNPDGLIDQIVAKNDYKKDRGWLLVKKSFGCPGYQISGRPYFVLYNKFTGVLRVFQLNLTNDFFSGMKSALVFTDDNGRRGATFNFSKPVQLAQDQYPLASDKMDYPMFVHEKSNKDFWLVSEYQVGFDPEVVNNLTKLRLTVDAINNGKITLGGKFTAETFMPPGYQVTSSNTDKCETALCDAGQFFGKNAKALKGAPKIFDEIKDFGKNTKISGTFVSKIQSFINKGFESGGIFTKLVAGATGISTAFDVLSKVTDVFIGIAKKKDTNPTSVEQESLPMITRGDINLSGSITTTMDVFSATLQAPGTTYSGNQNIPYINCPMGVLTLETTPEFEIGTVFPLRRKSDNTPDGCISYIAYSLKNPPTVLYNASSGLIPERIEVALQIKTKKVQIDYADDPYNAVINGINMLETDKETYQVNCGSGFVEYKNPVYNFLEDGKYLYNGYDDTLKEHYFSTKFVDITDARGLSIIAPGRHNILQDADAVRGLKIRAVFRDQSGVLTATEPVFFNAIYKCKVTNTTELYNYDESGLVPQNTSQSVAEGYEVKDDVVVTTNTFNNPVKYNALNSVTTQGDVVFNSTNSFKTVLQAGNLVKLTPGTIISKGENFVATTKTDNSTTYANLSYIKPLFAECSVTGGLIAKQPESENMLMGEMATLAEESVYPNPATVGANVSIQINYPTVAGKTGTALVTLTDLAGKKLGDRKVTNPGGSIDISELTVNLSAGIYLVTVSDQRGISKTSKLFIQ